MQASRGSRSPLLTYWIPLLLRDILKQYLKAAWDTRGTSITMYTVAFKGHTVLNTAWIEASVSLMSTVTSCLLASYLESSFMIALIYYFKSCSKDQLGEYYRNSKTISFLFKAIMLVVAFRREPSVPLSHPARCKVPFLDCSMLIALRQQEKPSRVCTVTRKLNRTCLK